MRNFLIFVLIMFGLSSASEGQDYSFTGTLSNDNDVQLFAFTADGISAVTMITYSYAGGTMADGTVIAAGGFDPILTLFNAVGIQMGFNDDGGAANVNADPVTGDYYDTYLSLVLGAGDYFVAVSQYNNFSNGSLASGFLRDGAGNTAFTSVYGCTNGFLCDVNADNRTSAWAFDVLGATTASTVGVVPEPSTWLMMLIGFGIVSAAARRKSKSIMI